MRRLLLLLALAGCSAAPAPVDRYFRLESGLAAPVATPLRGTLRIAPVRASGVVHERPMLFSRPDAPLQLERNPYALWSRPPVELVHDALLERLASAADEVVGADGAARPEHELRVRLLRFEQRLSAREPGAVLELEMQLWAGNRLRLSQRFEALEAAENPSPAAAAAALSRGLDRIVRRFLGEIPGR